MKNSAKSKRAIVYMARNKTNGKRYIGVTTHKTLARRESEHVSEAMRHMHNGTFHAAIRKHGRGEFEWTVLAECVNAREALKKEIILIAELKPEYNSTRGGEYWAPISKEALEKLRLIHKGNKYHAGKSHSEATKRALAKLAREQWKAGKSFGGKSGADTQAKRVVCLDNGRVFASASAAAREYRVSRSLLIAVCLRYPGQKTCAGKVFRYFGDHLGGRDEADKVKASVYAERKSDGTVNQVRVICLDDGKVYRSYQKAAEAYCLDAVSISCVCRGVRSRQTAGGLRFSHAPTS